MYEAGYKFIRETSSVHRLSHSDFLVWAVWATRNTDPLILCSSPTHHFNLFVPKRNLSKVAGPISGTAEAEGCIMCPPRILCLREANLGHLQITWILVSTSDPQVQLGSVIARFSSHSLFNPQWPVTAPTTRPMRRRFNLRSSFDHLPLGRISSYVALLRIYSRRELVQI